jgi:vacuolar-type H+-ATPase subunit E/Vma4
VLAAEKQQDELAHLLLQSAIQTARELRAQARLECEAIIRAARRRAVQIEDEARRSARRSTAELDRLQKIERDLRKQLRRTLQQVLDGEAPAAPAPVPPPAYEAAPYEAAGETAVHEPAATD